MLNRKYLSINIIIAIITFAIQYNGIDVFKAINVTPLLSLGFIVILSMFLSELSAFLLGLAFGIINDAISSVAMGFNSIVFPLIALCVSLLAHYLFNNNIKSSAVLSVSVSFIYLTVRFFVFYGFTNSKEILIYLFGTAFPSAIVTAVFSALIYLLEKRAFKDKQVSR